MIKLCTYKNCNEKHYGKGFCHFHYARKRMGRHILNYFKGKPKKNQVMFHTCNNKLCVLPSHLKWSTQKENNQYIFKCGRNRNQYST